MFEVSGKKLIVNPIFYDFGESPKKLYQLNAICLVKSEKMNKTPSVRKVPKNSEMFVNTYGFTAYEFNQRSKSTAKDRILLNVVINSNEPIDQEMSVKDFENYLGKFLADNEAEVVMKCIMMDEQVVPEEPIDKGGLLVAAGKIATNDFDYYLEWAKKLVGKESLFERREHEEEEFDTKEEKLDELFKKLCE